MGTQSGHTSPVLNVLRIWILLSALLVSSGWILSALHELNRGGYLIVFVAAATAAVWRWHKQLPSLQDFRRVWHKFARRFRRLAPQLFLVLALLCLTGGLLYVSNSGDSNSYRIPRVLHWLGREQWHWINTLDARMNFVGCDFEWLSAPLILFTGSPRWTFLINIVSFLMLPGLIFSVFTRLKVSPRTAWWWMWLLPSGWCFIFQAGSDLDDSFAAVYALAMVDFALRGCERKKAGDLWLSVMAAALVTGAKQTNIPLALLWFVAAWPGIRILLARPIATAFVAIAALLCSAVPITVLNIEHTGSWQGLPQGTASVWTQGSMPWRVVGNAFSIPLQNLVPPFFPPAEAWNRAMQHFVQTPFGSHFAFERFGELSSGVSEAEAGVGLGICVMTAVSLICARRFSRAALDGPNALSIQILWLRLSPWILLLVFMAGTCLFAGARIVAPYYPLLFPLLLSEPGNARLVYQRLWQWLCFLVMLLAAGMLVISRNRPLFPAQTVLKGLESKYPGAKAIRGIELAYESPGEVIKAQNHFRNDIPSGEQIIGYATFNGEVEPGLWQQPFGERQVERILPDDTPDELRKRNIHYMLVDENLTVVLRGMTIEQWMQRFDGELVDRFAYRTNRHGLPTRLYLVKLRSSTTALHDPTN